MEGRGGRGCKAKWNRPNSFLDISRTHVHHRRGTRSEFPGLFQALCLHFKFLFQTVQEKRQHVFQSKSLIPFPKSTYLRPNARTFSVQPGLRRHPHPSLRSHQHSSGRLSTHALTLLFQTQPTSLTSGREGKRKQPLPFQISMHISKAVEFGQVHQDPCRTPPISLPAETAVANAPAWRAVPILQDGE